MKEIPLHQEMVSVTGSVTWASHSPSVIGKNQDPRRQRDERHAQRYRAERTAGGKKAWHKRRKKMPLPRRARLSRGNSPASPAGAEREPDKTETGQHEVEHPVGGESARQDDLSSRTISGRKEKRSEVIPAPMIDYSDLSEILCSSRFRRFRS